MLVSKAFPPHHVRQRVTWKIIMPQNNDELQYLHYWFKKVRQSGPTNVDQRQIKQILSVWDTSTCICYWKAYVFFVFSCIQLDHLQCFEWTTNRFVLPLNGEFNWKPVQIGLFCSLWFYMDYYSLVKPSVKIVRSRNGFSLAHIEYYNIHTDINVGIFANIRIFLRTFRDI